MNLPPAVYCIIVDAKNDGAVAFYRRYGFRAFSIQPHTLFLPIATADEALLA
jgi:ribosomal protein S18 acetylase RimI-like enzyme